MKTCHLYKKSQSGIKDIQDMVMNHVGSVTGLLKTYPKKTAAPVSGIYPIKLSGTVVSDPYHHLKQIW